MTDERLFKLIKKSVHGAYVDMTVEALSLAKECGSGKFLHILCGGSAFLRRPISICDVYEDKVRFIFEVKGEGTKALAGLKVGDDVDILGPLGNGFDVSDSGTTVFVGGGIGTFPLLYAAREYFEKHGKKSYAVLGFRNKNVIYPQIIKDFEQFCNVVLLTDDGSEGQKGYAVNGLKQIIESENVAQIMTCGPEIMMNTVIAAARENNISCQASYEQRMGCGAGFCLCCTKKVDICGELKQICVCKDGPVIKVT